PWSPAGGLLSWPTRFSRRPWSRRYSVLKFNRGRDIPIQNAFRDCLPDHGPRREPREAEEGVEPVDDFRCACAELGGLTFAQLEQFNDLPGREGRKDARLDGGEELQDPLVDHRLFLFVERRLK